MKVAGEFLGIEFKLVWPVAHLAVDNALEQPMPVASPFSL